MNARMSRIAAMGPVRTMGSKQPSFGECVRCLPPGHQDEKCLVCRVRELPFCEELPYNQRRTKAES